MSLSLEVKKFINSEHTGEYIEIELPGELEVRRPRAKKAAPAPVPEAAEPADAENAGAPESEAADAPGGDAPGEDTPGSDVLEAAEPATGACGGSAA